MTEIRMIPVDLIDPHPHNPRRDLGDLTELAASIQAHGIRQNLLLTPWGEEGRYRQLLGAHARRGGCVMTDRSRLRLAARYTREMPSGVVIALLGQLEEAEGKLDDAVLYWKDARDALARQTPYLLAAEAAVERVRKLHESEVLDVHPGYGAEVWCPECQAYYPCPTIRALDGTDS